MSDLLDSSALAWAFQNAFTLWGLSTTWLEVLAFFTALAMVGCNMREIHWGWPLAGISSLLYFALCWRSKLYGDASLQLFFAVVAAWGWLQWLRGTAAPGDSLKITRLNRQGIINTVVACAVLWLLSGLFLKRFTDTDVPWWDAFPTAVSVVGTVLLGRKLLENWLLWVVVNAVYIGLYAYKGLWMTVLLSVIFTVLSVLGWRSWQQRMPAPARP